MSICHSQLSVRFGRINYIHIVEPPPALFLERSRDSALQLCAQPAGPARPLLPSAPGMHALLLRLGVRAPDVARKRNHTTRLASRTQGPPRRSASLLCSFPCPTSVRPSAGGRLGCPPSGLWWMVAAASHTLVAGVPASARACAGEQDRRVTRPFCLLCERLWATSSQVCLMDAAVVQPRPGVPLSRGRNASQTLPPPPARAGSGAPRRARGPAVCVVPGKASPRWPSARPDRVTPSGCGLHGNGAETAWQPIVVGGYLGDTHAKILHASGRLFRALIMLRPYGGHVSSCVCPNQRVCKHPAWP